jgi:hypothetical protein
MFDILMPLTRYVLQVPFAERWCPTLPKSFARYSLSRNGICRHLLHGSSSSCTSRLSESVGSVPKNSSHFSSDTIGATIYGATSISQDTPPSVRRPPRARAPRAGAALPEICPGTRHTTPHPAAPPTPRTRSRSGASTCAARAASYAMRWPIANTSGNERGRTSRSYVVLRWPGAAESAARSSEKSPLSCRARRESG